jgi:hypothetical protein
MSIFFEIETKFKTKIMKKLILALLAVISSATLLAQVPKVMTSSKEGWHKIGTTTVNFSTETDEITVLGADRFKAIKMKVTDAPIHLDSFEIFFESGDSQKVAIRKIIKKAGETKSVTISGGERSIKKVTFVYKTVPNNKDKKAHVELWGLK